MKKIFRIPYRAQLLYRFCKNFGLFNGVILFIRFQLEDVEDIKLPNYKHPLHLRKNTTDIQTFNQLFLDEEYEMDYKNPSIIIDGGANIGFFSIIMKNKYPNAKIICIEPDPENFEQLKKNLSTYSDVYFENCGIWNKDTKLKVYDKYNYGKWGIIVEEDPINGTIPAVTIDTIITKYNLPNIDVLKLDIESSEKQLFSEHYENWLPRVKILITETHDWMVKGCSESFFNAIKKTFTNYKQLGIGENTIIINEDFKN